MMRQLRSCEASCMSYHQVSEELETNLINGLTHQEASCRRRNHGFNEFEISDEDPLWKKYLRQVFICLHILIIKN